jgi:uncharacterized protein (TIGR01244 family)
MSDDLKVNDTLTVGRDQPSEEDLRRLAADGFAAIIDLRRAGEGEQALSPPLEAAAAGRHGLRYVHLPIPTDRLDDDMLDRFSRAVAGLPGPVFVHCASGKRSGTFAIVHAAVEEGLSGTAALARIEEAGVGYGSEEMRAHAVRYVDRQTGEAEDKALPRTGTESESAPALPEAARRVVRAVTRAVSDDSTRRIEKRVHWHAAHPGRVDSRLRELDSERDRERTLEFGGAAVAVGGLLLGAFLDRRFLILPAAVSALLLLRRQDGHTAGAIRRERIALKSLRGEPGESGARPASADAGI